MLILPTEWIQPSIYFLSFHKREQKLLCVIVFIISGSEKLLFFFGNIGAFLLTDTDFFHASSTLHGYFLLLLFYCFDLTEYSHH